MLNENAKKWVAALRSGKYKQAKRHLRTPDGFCCLGVLCDLYAKEGLGRWGIDFTDSDEGLSDVVMEWVGLAGREGSYSEHCLTAANDSQNKTFAQIADIIESEPEGLFIK